MIQFEKEDWQNELAIEGQRPQLFVGVPAYVQPRYNNPRYLSKTNLGGYYMRKDLRKEEM